MLPVFSLDFPFAYGALAARGEFRVVPEDFQVDEELGYELSGTGEHVFLQIRKRGDNTAWVAEKIAAFANVNINDVGYCGRKDRHAVTTQWFSVYLPKSSSADVSYWRQLDSESIQVLQVSRHHKKLRRGEHKCNHFAIRLRNIHTQNRESLAEKINNIFAQGVPNYFGEQRFGHDGNNLHAAQAVLVEGKRYKDKQKRGLMLSAARSYLFNLVLAERVRSNTWRQLLDGELDQPSAPLWGRGRSKVSGEAAVFEAAVLDAWSEWRNGLEHAGLIQERRPLVLLPSNPKWHWLDTDLCLHFTLGIGEFATAVLREVAELMEPEMPLISSQ